MLLFCSQDTRGTRCYFWSRRTTPSHTLCTHRVAIHSSNRRRSHATLFRTQVDIDTRRACGTLRRKLRREDRTQALWRPRDSSGLPDTRYRTPRPRCACGSCGRCPRDRADTQRCRPRAGGGAGIQDRIHNPAQSFCRTATVCSSSVDTIGMTAEPGSPGTCPAGRRCMCA
jgi:hypothetical protein